MIRTLSLEKLLQQEKEQKACPKKSADSQSSTKISNLLIVKVILAELQKKMYEIHTVICIFFHAKS